MDPAAEREHWLDPGDHGHGRDGCAGAGCGRQPRRGEGVLGREVQASVRSDRKVPKGSIVYHNLWVESDTKSRLTIQDRKPFGNTDEYVNVPTPTPQTNNLMELMAVIEDWQMFCFDFVSAFPHAKESQDGIWMWPPHEWKRPGLGIWVWWMRQSL